MSAAIGFRDHTGWAAAVVLETASSRPRVLASRRLRLCPEDLPGEVYHAAAGLDAESGKSLVSAVSGVAVEMAREQILDLLYELDMNVEGMVAGAPVGAGRIPASLAAITRVHAMMHAAEGHLFREALAEACLDLGLTVHRYPNKELPGLAASLLTAPDGLAGTLSAMGEGFGPPWTRDQKDAVTIAWLALAATA